MPNSRRSYTALTDEPTWYKDAIFYEVHVRAFQDSNNDGAGDFQGLMQRLDYLQDLGVTALWLLPFYASPLKDDGYDIADYTKVHPMYGNLRDFRAFLRETHRKGLRVITELVLNHTSDQHPWFQRARRAKPGSIQRDFYVWSDTTERYKDARIIFKDFEHSNWTWDPEVQLYYWHRFYSHQPDLNYDNPHVQRAMLRTVDFWLDIGVDGLRLDAVPYLYERDGTTCENLPETHEFLKKLRTHVDQKYRNRMLLAEANQWPEDAAAYFGDGDESNMAFHFPLMPRLFMAIRMEDRFPISDILDQTPAIPESCQWAIFLRNHDELTLEMVTDQERDYMYRTYAQDEHARINLGIRRRLAPLLGNDWRRIDLMNGLLFSLPGTPVLYYGDEIGMGDNIYLGDRNGVRTPMQWSPDRNAGFSRANPQQLYLPVIIDPQYHYETVNVEEEQANLHSLLWWMKRLIGLRQRFRAFGRGSLEFVNPQNQRVIAFIRRYEDERILVVANLSRFSQWAELDLSEFRGMIPVELFGQTRFPSIGELPYLVTLGPHAFYWFALESPEAASAGEVTGPSAEQLPEITVGGRWGTVLRGTAKSQLEGILPEYIRGQSWFQEKGQAIRAAEIVDAVPLPYLSTVAYITFVELEYFESDGETYVLPLNFAAGEESDRLRHDHPEMLIARLQVRDRPMGFLYEAFAEEGFANALIGLVGRAGRLRGSRGRISASMTQYFRDARREDPAIPAPRLLRLEQSNTSVAFGDRFVLKLFRRPEPGINPDVELGSFLTQRGFVHAAPVAGSIRYQAGRLQPATLAILNGFVPNQGTAWDYSLEFLRGYYERALAQPPRTGQEDLLLPQKPLSVMVDEDYPAMVEEMISTYVGIAEAIGRTTGELHLALASDALDPNFAPEPLTAMGQRSLYQSLRSSTRQTFQMLRSQLGSLDEEVRPSAEEALGMEQAILNEFRAIYKHRIGTQLIRCHGNYNLTELLRTEKDFVIVDFEGESARPLTERRAKYSPLRDVAGMLRSFHYAAHAALRGQPALTEKAENQEALVLWRRFWHQWVSVIFLKSYLATCGDAPFLPRKREDLQLLLSVHLLQKAIYELQHDLGKRPDWAGIPLRAILYLANQWPAERQSALPRHQAQ